MDVPLILYLFLHRIEDISICPLLLAKMAPIVKTTNFVLKFLVSGHAAYSNHRNPQRAADIFTLPNEDSDQELDREVELISMMGSYINRKQDTVTSQWCIYIPPD